MMQSCRKRKITSYFSHETIDTEECQQAKRKGPIFPVTKQYQLTQGYPISTDFHFENTVSDGLNVNYGIVFKKKIADRIYDELEKEIAYDKVSQVKIFGKTFDVPRKQTAFGDPGLSYTFSGVTISAKKWNTILSELKLIVERICKQEFNFVLINRYKDGSEYMGEHRDDESDLDLRSAIASLSFGQSRDFIFKHKSARTKKVASDARVQRPVVKFTLTHGSLLVMNSPTNEMWYHSLPKRSIATCPSPRINLTFRRMKK